MFPRKCVDLAKNSVGTWLTTVWLYSVLGLRNGECRFSVGNNCFLNWILG